MKLTKDNLQSYYSRVRNPAQWVVYDQLDRKLELIYDQAWDQVYNQIWGIVYDQGPGQICVRVNEANKR